METINLRLYDSKSEDILVSDCKMMFLKFNGNYIFWGTFGLGTETSWSEVLSENLYVFDSIIYRLLPTKYLEPL